MKKSIPFWQMAGFLFVSITGTLLHFAYDWSGRIPAVGLISAVNESIWEHVKLIFYPMVLFAVAEYRAWGRRVPGFLCTKTAGILTAVLLIPVFYYTYIGIWGISVDWINIVIFFLAAAVSLWAETHSFQTQHLCRCPGWLAIALLMILAAMFVAFTFRPPEIPFFRDPITGSYGI